MTPREAGAQLGLHASTVRDRCAAGRIAATKTECGWQIDPAALAGYQIETARAALAAGEVSLRDVAGRFWAGDIEAARRAIYAGCQGGRPR